MTKTISDSTKQTQTTNKFKPFVWPGIAILSVIIISITLFSAVKTSSSRAMIIRNIESGTVDGRQSNTISTSGMGKVTATPDMVTFSAGFSETKSNSKEALEVLNNKINELRSRIRSFNISDTDIKTDGLSIYANNDNNKVKDYTARQNLTFTLKNIDSKATRAGELIDKITSIDGIMISRINFDVENKELVMKQAREQAIIQAKTKAQELASISNVELGSVISISDQSSNYADSQDFENNRASYKAIESRVSDSTTINTGQTTSSLTLSVVFEIYPKTIN